MKCQYCASSVSRSFFLLSKVYCCRNTGHTANCAPSRKSDCCLSVGGAVAVIQHLFNVGFTVEDFTAQLDIGDTPFIAVVLKCPAAHLQPCRHLLVSEETLTAQCRAVVGGQVLYIINSRSRLPIKWIIHSLSLLISSFILLWI